MISLYEGVEILSIRKEKNTGSHSNMKGFQISAFFVEFWVMMRSIALVFKVNPKITGNMGTSFVQAMVPKEVLKSKKLPATVGMRKEWMRIVVISIF